MNKNLLVFFFRESFLRGYLPRLNDDLVKLESDCLSFQDFLLNCWLSDQTVDKDLFLLPDTMSSIHGLKINLRIPIRVIQNDMVSSHEIYTETSCSCWKHENADLRIWRSELSDLLFSLFKICTSIQTTISEPSHGTVIFKNVKKTSEVWED